MFNWKIQSHKFLKNTVLISKTFQKLLFALFLLLIGTNIYLCLILFPTQPSSGLGTRDGPQFNELSKVPGMLLPED